MTTAFDYAIDWDNTGNFDGPGDGNQIVNGDFNNGETGWTFVDGIVHTVASGKLEIYRNGGASAAVYQEFAYATSPGDGFAVSFKVANPSLTQKTITVLVSSEGAAVNWFNEAFIIAAGAGETTKTFNGIATSASDNVRFVIRVDTDDNDPELTIDNVSVAPTANRITNGDFASGEDDWTFVGGIVHAVASGKLEAYRNGGAIAFFRQEFTYLTAPGDEFSVSFKVANTSGTEKTITVLVADEGATTTWFSQVYVIAAGAGESTKAFSGTAITGSPGARLTIRIDTDDNDPELTFDDISVTTTHCKDDITQYVDSTASGIGLSNENAHMATAGQCVLVLDNRDRRFSPLYTLGENYGKLVPGLPVRVRADYGTVKTIFYGYTRDIEPEPGASSVKRAIIQCEDQIGRMNRAVISAEIQENKTADELLKTIFTDVWSGTYATGTITFVSNADQNETLTIGDTTFTFVTLGDTGTNILIGVTKEDTAASLADRINTPTLAATALEAYRPYSATVSGAVVTVTAQTQGAAGNSLALANATSHRSADSATIIDGDGVIVSGDVTDTYTQNGVYLQVEEVTGTPGYDLEMPATVAGIGLSAGFYGRYQGSIGHTVNVDAWNDGGAVWDLVGNLVSTGTDESKTFTLLPAHTAGGIVKLRFYHASPGNTSHDLYIDHYFVVDDTATSPGNLTLSGATFTGGADAPAGFLDLEVGERTYSIAADFWDDERTTAAAASRDVVLSEYGDLWAARDGKLTFKNRYWRFGLPAVTPVLTLDNTHDSMSGRLTVDRVRNRMRVRYTPRRELASGVIAQASNPIRVPGNSGTDRWSSSQGYVGSSNADAPQPGDKLVRLPFVDPDSGRFMGAKDVATPVVSTDFTVNDQSDGSGFDYSASNRIVVSIVTTGSGVEASFRNTATGPLFVRDFQVRGVGILSFNPQESIREDTASIANHGRRDLTYNIPLESGEVFADAIADYELSRFKTPRYVVDKIQFEKIDAIGAVSLLSIEVGDVLAFGEGQTGATSIKAVVIGIDYRIQGGALVDTVFSVREISDATYWILDDATYSVLGTTTRLGL